MLSVPCELRLLLASRPEVLGAVVRIAMRVVLGFYRKRGRELGLGKAEPGAVPFVQPSGGSLNSNPHLHSIAIDGLYTRCGTGGAQFHFVQPPSAAELVHMVATICERVCRMLARRGLLGEPDHDSNEAEAVPDALVGCRKVSLSRGRFERLDERGRAQQQLFPDDEQGFRRAKDSRWAAHCKGFSLHAGVSFGALDRKGRERLVRYCTRAPPAMERLSVLRDGSVAYKLNYGSAVSGQRSAVSGQRSAVSGQRSARQCGSNQRGEHLAHLNALVRESFVVRLGQVSEVTGEQEVVLGLARRAGCHRGEACQLRVAATAAPLRDVGRNRARRPSHRRSQPESLLLRKRSGDTVYVERETMCALPNLQSLEIPHGSPAES